MVRDINAWIRAYCGAGTPFLYLKAQMTVPAKETGPGTGADTGQNSPTHDLIGFCSGPFYLSTWFFLFPAPQQVPVFRTRWRSTSRIHS